jgi:hypothetical protein
MFGLIVVVVFGGLLGPDIARSIGFPAAILLLSFLGYLLSVCELWFIQPFALPTETGSHGKILTYK